MYFGDIPIQQAQNLSILIIVYIEYFGPLTLCKQKICR